MARLWVQVCRRNQAAALLRADPGVATELEVVVEAVDCLDRCTLCEKGPFALVNGRMLYAETGAQLLALLRQGQERTLRVPNEDRS